MTSTPRSTWNLDLFLDGREIPNAAVLGSALEEAVKLVQDRITESYQVVPVRNEPPANATVTQIPVAENLSHLLYCRTFG